jgi:hypothetical protein
MSVAEKTDDQISEAAVRAANIAIKAAKATSTGGGQEGLNAARAAEAAIGQTVALEVAKPTVTLAGGTVDNVGKIENPVTVQTSRETGRLWVELPDQQWRNEKDRMNGF